MASLSGGADVPVPDDGAWADAPGIRGGAGRPVPEAEAEVPPVVDEAGEPVICARGKCRPGQEVLPTSRWHWIFLILYFPFR